MTFRQQSGIKPIVVAVFKNEIFHTYFGQAFVSDTFKEKNLAENKQDHIKITFYVAMSKIHLR